MSGSDRREFLQGLVTACAAGSVSGCATGAGAERDLGSQPGLILPLGPVGSWDSAQASCPRVLRLASGEWRMWYYGRDPAFDPLVRLPTGRIGLATSMDGLNWRRVRGGEALGAVLAPSADASHFDAAHVGLGDVHATGQGFDMWYFGGPARTSQVAGMAVTGFPLRIGRAQSADGKRWTRVPGPYEGAWLDNGKPGEADAFMAGWPQVMRLADGRLRMYYHSYQPTPNRFVICAAESADGREWKKLGAILAAGTQDDFDADGSATRHVISLGDRWLMFYEGFARQHASIGLAESADGLSWRRVRGPLAGGAIHYRAPAGSGRWDAGAVGTPWVVPMPDGSLRMYYVGADQREDRLEAEAGATHQIGLATCDGRNLTDWQRWSGCC